MINKPAISVLSKIFPHTAAAKNAAALLALLALCAPCFSQNRESTGAAAQSGSGSNAATQSQISATENEKSADDSSGSTDDSSGSTETETAKPAEPEDDDEESTAGKMFQDTRFGADGEYLLKIDGDTRYRAEYRDNYDFDHSRADRNAHPQFLRSRLRFDLTHREITRVFLELIDSREWNRQEGDRDQHNPADIQQAYLELHQPDEGPWSVRLGRQELVIGRDRRLLDATSWSNIRDRFFGARATYSTEELDLDLFLTHPERFEYDHYGRTVTGRGRPSRNEWFYGAYLTSRHLADHTIESYFLGLSDTDDHRTFPSPVQSEDGTFGSTNRYTIGSAMYGPLAETENGELTYTIEGAYQFGRLSKDDIKAYLLRGDIKHEWTSHKWKPSLALVSTLASGDRDPADGRAGTFDRLFGSGHSPYGIMDIVTARNLRELAIVGTVEPTKKLSFQAEAHAYWADSKTDTALQPPGEDSLRDRTGRSGRNLGQEISLVTEYKLTENVELEGGAARFFTDSFGRNLDAGDGANFFYIQTEIKF